MPFKSRAQQRYMFAAEERGEIKKGTAEKWAKETPNIKKLPARVGKIKKHVPGSLFNKYNQKKNGKKSKK